MKILKTDYRGELEIGEMQISCAVLEDGTRIISETSIVKYLGSVGGKNYKLRAKEENQNNNIDFLPLFVASKALHPFISEVFTEEDLVPIIYTTDGKNKQQGYDATILPKVCEIWLKAREANTLQASQLPKALKAEILMRSLAKLGITALVDEATGYQYDREKYELQKIFKAYISEELLPWQKMFPDIFYKELFRLNGWDFNVNGIKKRPGVIGTWTKKLIYEELPKGVLEKLEKNTPKSIKGNKTARLHQSLTIDIGNPHLKEQINKCITLFQLSDNMKHMWYHFKKIKDRQKGQLDLPFQFDNEGHTIENQSLQKVSENKSSKRKSKITQPKLF
jgi:hypothetical protein